jgi:TolA-binding protein
VEVVNGDNLTKDELLSRFLQMQGRIDELEEKLDRKDEQIKEQQERIDIVVRKELPPETEYHTLRRPNRSENTSVRAY